MGKQGQAGRIWLRQEGRTARRAAASAIGAGVFGVILAIVQAACVADVLGTALNGAVFEATPLVLFALAAVARAGLIVLADWLAAAAGGRARRRLRTDAMARLLAAGPSVLRQAHSANWSTTVVDRVDALDGFFSRWIPASSLALVGPLLVLGAVVAVDWRAALILGGAGLLVPVAQAVSGIGAAVASRRQFTALSRLQARFLDRISGIATIVLAGRAADESTALAAAADELRVRTMRVLRVAFLSSAALDCALALALVVLALRYGAAAVAGHLDPAPALFVLLLVPEFFVPLRAFAVAYQDRMQAAGAADELAALPAAPAPPSAGPIRTVEARGVTVAFERVGFTWDPDRGAALDDITFRVPAGETLVLAGPSGAGKSTIIEILLGFVRPTSGHVLVNGADIATIVPEALARMTIWIGQRPVLFAGTIRDNVRFGRPAASEAEIESAARSAHVTDFAAALPDGLDTIVGEGGYGLSGGQAQRVAIARAFLKNAPLLLLDEPTAHLDPATEAEVMASLRRLAVGRTVVLASHATAVHGFSSRRLDLRDGRVVPARGAA